MAWIDCERTGIFQIGFCFGGRRVKRSLRTRDQRVAEAAMHRVEENIRLVTTGRLTIPLDADVASFLLSDGKLATKELALPKIILLGDLFERYSTSIPPDALAPETLRIAAIHMRHVVRIIGQRRQLRTLQRDDLQQYVNTRSNEIGKRGRPVSAGTIQKEVSSFRTLWRWAKQSELVSHDFPNQGLRYPRKRQKFPFQIWDQIEARIKRGVPEGHSEADYWDCLFLSNAELNELLEDVRRLAIYDFLYPMTFMAAHTGARRSELCRSMQSDIDFENNTILIREKKRQKGTETFRHVPMSPRLREVLSTWFNHTMLSVYTFPAEHRVARERNGNRRENDESVAPDEATDHLSTTLRDTRWKVIRGWHIFRHSFISNCASLAVDQRMIDAWVGHQTEDMRKRYRHLFPHRQRIELERVFGATTGEVNSEQS